MSLLPVDHDIANATASISQRYWLISDIRSINIGEYKEYAVHGDLVVDGQVVLRDNSRLIIER